MSIVLILDIVSFTLIGMYVSVIVYTIVKDFKKKDKK